MCVKVQILLSGTKISAVSKIVVSRVECEHPILFLKHQAVLFIMLPMSALRDVSHFVLLRFVDSVF